MAPKRLRTLIPIALIAVACTGANGQSSIQKARTLSNYEDAVGVLWDKVPSDPKKRSTDRHRALLQLGMPTSTSVALWHLCPKEDENCSIAVSAKGIPASGIKVSSPIAGGRRIVVDGLRPNTLYDIQVSTCAGGKCAAADSIQAWTARRADDRSSFSFLVASCNETLVVTDKHDTIDPIKLNSLNLVRLRAEGVLQVEGVPERPDFFMGLGDQVYMDPEGDEDRKNRGFSLFRGTRSDKRQFQTDLNPMPFALEASRHAFAIPPLDDAFRVMPSVMVWDDHEIRDGWRNQNDETTGPWPAWYRAARTAYVRDQVLRARDPESLATTSLNTSTHAKFDWGALAQVFMLDTRSGSLLKPKNARELFGEKQWQEFNGWLKDALTKPASLIIVGLPTPLTYTTKDLGKVAGAVVPELRDDVEDQIWSSKAGEELASLLANSFGAAKNSNGHRLLILSGDIHTSAVTELHTDEGIIGYEVISSGIAASRSSAKETFMDWGEVSREYDRLAGWSMATVQGTPAFAEVVVVPRGDGAPDVNVFFYPSLGGGGDTGLPVNPAAYLEKQKGSWASRPYIDNAHATDAGIAFVSLFERGGQPTAGGEKKNGFHVQATTCAQYNAPKQAPPSWYGAQGGDCKVKEGDADNAKPTLPPAKPRR